MDADRIGARAGKIAASPARFLHVRDTDQRFPENRHFFAAIKNLDRTAGGQPTVEIEQRGPHELAVRLSGPAYLHFVNLQVPFEETRFSDNYFDLRGGQSRTIVIRNPARAIGSEDLTVKSR